MRWSIKNSFSKRNYRLLRKKRIIGSNLPKSFRNTIWNWQTRVQMKKNFICTKKSVRTFKLRIEPSFLSHAERGKTFWIREFLAGMRLCRSCGATQFRLQNAISISGGIHCTKFECILKATLIPTNRTRGARGDSKLPRTLVSFRHCLAEPRQPRKKNTPCFLDLAGVKFLLKKERVFFFRGSAFQVFRQVAEQCGRSFGKTIFWGKDLPKLRLICF